MSLCMTCGHIAQCSQHKGVQTLPTFRRESGDVLLTPTRGLQIDLSSMEESPSSPAAGAGGAGQEPPLVIASVASGQAALDMLNEEPMEGREPGVRQLLPPLASSYNPTKRGRATAKRGRPRLVRQPVPSPAFASSPTVRPPTAKRGRPRTNRRVAPTSTTTVFGTTSSAAASTGRAGKSRYGIPPPGMPIPFRLPPGKKLKDIPRDQRPLFLPYRPLSGSTPVTTSS